MTAAHGSSPRGRVTGVTMPLFSLRSTRSWGIGEIGDLPAFANWLAEAGVKLVQILPLGEIAGNETSPYAALSAFGIDPLYLSLADLEDLPPDAVREAVGGDLGITILEQARANPQVDYTAVRFVKSRALRVAFERFRASAYTEQGPRAQAFATFVEQHRLWLEDYALYRALKDAHGGSAWWDWPAALRDREQAALASAGAELQPAVLFHKYLQWLAHTQWEATRAALHGMNVQIMGDLPFMVGRDSADVWANQHEFRLDMNVGVPADQFDPEGQDWGLPPYRWDAMRANDFAWLRRRARYAGTLYDRFRIDHLVGFYRTGQRPMPPRDAQGKLLPAVFDPPDERSQLAHGERVVTAMLEAARERGAELIAEDLGSVPDWVRASLTRLGVPGYKVLIWEKDGDAFRDPSTYPALSVASFGTHDTDPIAVWWETRQPAERAALLQLPGLREQTAELGARFTPAVHRALLDLLQRAPSELVLLLMQDVLGTQERINTPGTVGPQNWSYRLPAPVEVMARAPEVQRALDRLHQSIYGAGR